MDDHISEVLSRPAFLRVGRRMACLRFETMKVASAVAAVRDLLRRGVVAPGDTLVDSSSGIYAHALALACHRYGLRCHIVASITVDRALQLQLDLLGATVDRMPPAPNLKLDQDRRVARVRELLRAHADFHWMRQYHDDIHYLGYESVAATVLRETGDTPLTLVGCVGTGASTGALTTYLRRGGREVRLVGVQPFDSVTFGSDHVHDPEIIIAGIGSSIPFANVDHELYDVVHWIGFHAALSGGVALLRDTAVFAGLSSGAAYLAATWEHLLDPHRQVVFLAPDTGHRYVDSAYTRHPTAARLDTLAPTEVTTTADLTLPWSRMTWAGAAAPPRAAVRPLPTAARRKSRGTPAPPAR